MMISRWRLLAAIPLALAFSACDGGTTDDGNADTGVNDSGTNDPCLEANFTSIYTDRLHTTKYCAAAGCHDPQTAGGGQNYALTKAAVHDTLLSDTVNSIGAPDYPKRVTPGDPDMSFLWIKLTRDDAPLGRMPLAKTPLQQCDLDAINTWITNGAMDD